MDSITKAKALYEIYRAHHETLVGSSAPWKELHGSDQLLWERTAKDFAHYVKLTATPVH